MAKEKIICNHCDIEVEWYLSMLDEVGYKKIDNKMYCEECLNKLAHAGVDA